MVTDVTNLLLFVENPPDPSLSDSEREAFSANQLLLKETLVFEYFLSQLENPDLQEKLKEISGISSLKDAVSAEINSAYDEDIKSFLEGLSSWSQEDLSRREQQLWEQLQDEPPVALYRSQYNCE